MNIAKDETGNFRAFNKEVARIFQRAMDEARDAGQARNISKEAICVAIAVRAGRCQALAIVGGNLPVDEFETALAKDIVSIRSAPALSGLLGPRQRPS